MVKINLANFVTVGLIAVIATVGLKYGLAAVGMKPSWL